MPALTHVVGQIKRTGSQSTSWPSVPLSLTLLYPRQSFPDSSFPNSNFPDSNFNKGLHPAAIFGIVAGVMFVIIIVGWCFWFSLIKKALTNREYGVLHSIRNASNRYGNNNGHNNYHGYGYGPGNDPYGPNPSTGYGYGYGNGNGSYGGGYGGGGGGGYPNLNDRNSHELGGGLRNDTTATTTQYPPPAHHNDSGANKGLPNPPPAYNG